MELLGLFIFALTSYFYSFRLALFLFNLNNIMLNGFNRKSMILILNNIVINFFGVKQVLFFMGLLFCVMGILFIENFIDIGDINLNMKSNKFINYYNVVSDYLNSGNEFIINNTKYCKDLLIENFPVLEKYYNKFSGKIEKYGEYYNYVNNINKFEDKHNLGNLNNMDLETLENMDIDKMLNDTLFNENFLKDFSNMANDFRGLLGKKKLNDEDVNKTLNFSFKKTLEMLEPHMLENNNINDSKNNFDNSEENFKNLEDEINNLFKKL